MSSEIVIKVENLSKCYQIYEQPRDRLKQFFLPRLQRFVAQTPRQYYREFWALKDVTFEVKKGQTVGIIGRNGSGKSTLLQIICGTLSPTSGNISTQGRVAALLELGSGFNPEFTGRENVYLNASVLGLAKHEIDARFDEIIEFADIGDFIGQPVKTYSSGMMVRLAFAVIAHVDADLLVIDEALAVGDAFFTQKCMRFLHQFMEHGTVLFVSHDSGAVTNLCDLVIWIDRGCTKAIGDPKIISEDYLAAIYEDNSGVKKNDKESTVVKDMNVNLVGQDVRFCTVNNSVLRNELEVFSFDLKNARGFGKRDAEIYEVKLLDINGNKINQFVGGEIVELYIGVFSVETIYRPIVGFSLKDRLGQVLFGDNTYITYMAQDIVIEKGGNLSARFRFQMPILPVGDYTIAAAIATGTQVDHCQQHWIHDALVIKSVSSSVSTGLVGIPMYQINLEVNGGH